MYMVYRRKYFKRRARRKYGRKRRPKYNPRSRVTSKVMRQPTGIPDKMYIKLKYSTNQLIASSGNTPGLYIFRGNSVFDPDYSGIGDQPVGFDQWAQFYKDYKVLASKITVTAIAQSNLAANVACVSINPETSVPTTGLTPINLIQHPYSRHRYIGQGDGPAPPTFSNYMTTKKMYGLKDVCDEQYIANVATNPQIQWYWNVSISPTNNTTSVGANIVAVITYYVEFSNRILLPQS